MFIVNSRPWSLNRVPRQCYNELKSGKLGLYGSNPNESRALGLMKFRLWQEPNYCMFHTFAKHFISRHPLPFSETRDLLNVKWSLTHCLSSLQNLKRYFSSQDEDQSHSKKSMDEGGKLLENHPLILWPSFLQMIRNWILSAFIIRPHYDSTFTVESFMDASVKAICIVSQLMSAGNFDVLKEMIDSKTLSDFKEVYKHLSTRERMRLTIVPEDIVLKTLLMLGLIFEEPKNGRSHQRVFLEITMLYHIYQGFEDYLKNKTDFTSIQQSLQPSDNIVVNFRFFREITKGCDDQYIINSLNYFKPLIAVEK